MLASVLLFVTAADQLVRGRFKDGDISMPYVVSLPQNYEKSKAKWPAVLYLHGGGLRGDNVAELERYGLLRDIKGGREFPFLLIAPQCPAGDYWRGNVLRKLLNSVEGKYRIDTDCVYVTGLSHGGYGTWAAAQDDPKRFAAIIPLCGGGDPVHADLLKDLPTWVVHGEKDDVVPLQVSRWMVDAIRRAGGNPRFDVVKDTGHDVWTKFYASDDWWKWLLGHKRK